MMMEKEKSCAMCKTWSQALQIILCDIDATIRFVSDKPDYGVCMADCALLFDGKNMIVGRIRPGNFYCHNFSEDEPS